MGILDKIKAETNEFTLCKSIELTAEGVSTFYFTRKNGDLISGSMSMNHDTAKEFFKEFVSLGGKTKKEEVLEVVFIDEKKEDDAQLESK